MAYEHENVQLTSPKFFELNLGWHATFAAFYTSPDQVEVETIHTSHLFNSRKSEQQKFFEEETRNAQGAT